MAWKPEALQNPSIIDCFPRLLFTSVYSGLPMSMLEYGAANLCDFLRSPYRIYRARLVPLTALTTSYHQHPSTMFKLWTFKCGGLVSYLCVWSNSPAFTKDKSYLEHREHGHAGYEPSNRTMVPNEAPAESVGKWQSFELTHRLGFHCMETIAVQIQTYLIWTWFRRMHDNNSFAGSLVLKQVDAHSRSLKKRQRQQHVAWLCQGSKRTPIKSVSEVSNCLGWCVFKS